MFSHEKRTYVLVFLSHYHGNGNNDSGAAKLYRVVHSIRMLSLVVIGPAVLE